MKRRVTVLLFLALLMGSVMPAAADDVRASAVADPSLMVAAEEVLEEGMSPIRVSSLLDGEYPVSVSSSSTMFRIESALLRVREGKMEAELTMGGKGYLYIYPGSAPEAAAAEEDAYIPFRENGEGAHCFTIPVEALDAAFPCAAFSKNKELWYDRMLLVRADSLPPEAFREGFFTTAESLGLADGSYLAEVTLAGGSGRASVENPARLTVKEGMCTATIIWGSRNYDYMTVGGERFLPIGQDGFSTFEIPVSFFDRPMPVIADTVAMSRPHEIAYTLCFDSESIEALP